MTFPPLASLAALEVLLAEPLTAAQRARAEALLAGVSAEAREVTGRAWTLPSGELDPERPALLEATVLRAAERAVRNPQTLAAETLGDYSRRFASGDPAPAGVYLSSGEAAALARLVDPGDLVSVETVRDVTVSDHRWPYPRRRWWR